MRFRFWRFLSLSSSAVGFLYWLVSFPLVVGATGNSVVDPELVWAIGRLDNTAKEFSTGSATNLTYVVGESDTRDWKEQQVAGTERDAPVYQVVFRLSTVPLHPVLIADLYTLGIQPTSARIQVNGRTGVFGMRPHFAEARDDEQGNSPLYCHYTLRMPIPQAVLRVGSNEIGISFLAMEDSVEERSDSREQGRRTVFYDRLVLARSTDADTSVSAEVAPTIFFKRSKQGLVEVIDVIVRHSSPIGDLEIIFTVNGALARLNKIGPQGDFGERLLEAEIPARSTGSVYALDLKAAGKRQQFKGKFFPRKRWRLFACPKIHNDIGYTDYQSKLREFDARNLDQVLRILSKDPDYKFVVEDAWLAENYMTSRTAEKNREFMSYMLHDRLSVNPFFLNLLTGLCSGEELYRALYFGHALQQRAGTRVRAASFTDVPSHTWFVPTLLADVGITGFAVGSNQTRAPLLNGSGLNEDSPFFWEGADGRRVIAWFARSYRQIQRLVGTPLGNDQLRSSLLQFLTRYERPDYTVDAVMVYGLYSDNAPMGQRELEVLNEWNKHYEFPKIIISTDTDYFDYISAHFARKLPTLRGDGGAYWEDGAASTAIETAHSRSSKTMLLAAETAASLAKVFSPTLRYPVREFTDAWRSLLFYEEHSWGSNHALSQPNRDYVTDEWQFKRDFARQASEGAKELLLRSMSRLVQNISIAGPTLFIFNPNLERRTDSVEVELDSDRQLIDPFTRHPVSLEVLNDMQGYRRVRFTAEDVPGFGYKAYEVSRYAVPLKTGSRVVSDQWAIHSKYYNLRVDPVNGGIQMLDDLQLHRDLVDHSSPYRINQLLYVSGGEGSSIVRNDLGPPAKLTINSASSVEVVENSGNRMVIRANAPSIPEMETVISLSDSFKRVDIVNRFQKTPVYQKEAVYFAFPFAPSGQDVGYQIQNTWVRPTVDHLPGAGCEWFATQNVAFIRDRGLAVAWATPDAPLLTFGDINRGLWLKSLPRQNGSIFAYVMNNYWFTNYKAAQGGRATFRFYITSAEHLSFEELAHFDSDTRCPLITYTNFDTKSAAVQPEHRPMPQVEGSFFDIDSSHAELSAFKLAEDSDGYIMRIRESGGRKDVVRLRTSIFRIISASLCNGVEENLSSIPVRSNSVIVPLNAWAFTTIRLRLAGPVSNP